MPNDRPIHGKVTLTQNSVPALDAGEYEIQLAQAVTVNGAPDTFPASARFAVKGRRFGLDPADLHSIFPADNVTGEYASVLPHVVLTRTSLPWERSPLAGALPPKSDGADTPAWLALLLVDEDDLAAYPSFDPRLKNAKAKDLFPPAVCPDSTLGGNLSYFAGVAKTSDGLDLWESPDDDCSVVDLPLSLFRAIAPSVEDLQMLAHVRDVSLENQERGPEQDGADDAGAGFSVLIANRLPAPGRRSWVYLVSLENLDAHLPGGERCAEPDRGAFIRLIALKAWSFTALDQSKPGTDFVKVLRSVSVDVLQRRAPGAAAKKDADATVTQALSLGYVPMGHDLRGGGRTVSWYRGPLLPCARARGLVLPIGSADAATRYDPDSGMLDVSYAVAWQLGRLLALQDKAYSSALYGWKRGIEKELVVRAADEPPAVQLRRGLLSGLKEQAR